MRLALLLASVAFSQDMPDWQVAAGGKMSFDVASVKLDPGPFRPPNFPLDPGDAYKPTGGRFFADFALVTYIRFAYKLALTQEQVEAMIGNLPKWVSTDRFAIDARAENPTPTKDQMRLMMQSLLADRFKLQAHYETHEMPVYALTLSKAGRIGSKLRPHSEGPGCGSGDANVFPPRCDVYELMAGPNGLNRAGSRNTTMELIAGALPTFSRLGRPVIDRTGLNGRFDFTLEWSPEAANPENPPDLPGPTFLDALREQLGLRLESTRGPVKTLVIDHVERPSEN
jgi:uncharacterized protein (TIGR03435 family)